MALLCSEDKYLVQEMEGPIVKFVLSNPDVESCSDIDCWILFLSNNNIQDFTLRIWRAVICLSRVAENVEHLVEGRTSNLIKVFGCLPVIENLCVSGYFLKFLAVGNVLKRLPMTLKHMKILRMGDLRFAKMDEISCALCLIRSSPNLQELKIWASRNTSSFMEPCCTISARTRLLKLAFEPTSKSDDRTSIWCGA
ncbi:hypothetical protein L1049_006492 [Liquidambar formosana]|uniref:Uncharacterized protein n=1 Tax=Liquidambar formosana TaxID=63359 RepID=A0AAP0WU72_LIQFO